MGKEEKRTLLEAWSRHGFFFHDPVDNLSGFRFRLHRTRCRSQSTRDGRAKLLLKRGKKLWVEMACDYDITVPSRETSLRRHPTHIESVLDDVPHLEKGRVLFRAAFLTNWNGSADPREFVLGDGWKWKNCGAQNWIGVHKERKKPCARTHTREQPCTRKNTCRHRQTQAISHTHARARAGTHAHAWKHTRK